MGKLALVLFICILPWGFWKMNFSEICWKQYRKDKKIFLYLLRRVYRKASLHTKWPWTVAGKLCNQLDTKPKSQTQASPIAWLGYGQAKWARKWARKKKSNGQTSQIQQTDERGQHGSWQTRAQKKNMEQKQDRDQLSPLPRSDSKWWLSEGKLSKGSSPTQSRTGPPSANEHTCLLEQSISMAGTSSSVKVPFLVVCGHRRSRVPTLRPPRHLTALPIYFCNEIKGIYNI